MKELLFIVNGVNKNASVAIAQIKNHFDAGTFDVVVTQKVGHAKELATQGIQDGFTKIICAGGDGTINEMVNGVMKGIETLDIEKKKIMSRLLQHR